ncbi:MAG: hypothetical protein N3A69_00895 [Leptospiraceae bacterium]|nr:hypothetical protein [Leptospiraceae bacterium]
MEARLLLTHNVIIFIFVSIFLSFTNAIYSIGFCTKKNFETYCGVLLKKEYRIDHVKSSFSPLCDFVFLWINTEKEGGGTENCFICILEPELKELEALQNTKSKKCGKLYKIRKKDYL